VTAFFLAPESPRLPALVRIALGVVLLVDAGLHWRYAVELYSTFGPPIPTFVRESEAPMDQAAAGDEARMRHVPRVKPILLAPIPSPAVAVVAHTLLVFALASVMLGWHTRKSVAAAFLLALWLAPLDVTATFGKHFVLALHVLLLLGFSRCGRAWSVDACLSPGRGELCRLSCAAPRRLIQILVCFVYAGAAITKIKSASFVNGDLLMFSLLDDRWGGGRFGMWLTTLRHVPLFLSHATLLFEIVFPILVWLPRWRLPLLGAAFAVHAAMGWLLSLGIFSPVMFAALLAFLEERDLARIGGFVSSLSPWERGRVKAGGNAAVVTPPLSQRATEQRHALRNAACHLLAAAAFVAAGYAVQISIDWYGAFGGRSLPGLEEVADGDVAEMLAERPPAWEDYFHRVELGSRFGGNQVFGSADRFQIGQRAFVLAQMPMPHPAVELEGLLIGPDGQKCARFTHRFDSGFSYTINGFELTAKLPPGPYRVLLRVEDFVVAERRFMLEP
jgi:hypothetical protein